MRIFVFTGIFGALAVFALAFTVVTTPAISGTAPVFQFSDAADSASSVPTASGQLVSAQLLTIRCTRSQGDIRFTEQELEKMVRITEDHPSLVTQTCKLFTLKVNT